VASGSSAPRGTGIEARRQALWSLARIETDASMEAARIGLEDPSRDVRHVAAHVAGLWRDRQAVPALLALLRPYEPALCRVAAEALGRIGDASAVPALLEAAGHPMDRMLEHSLIYALIEIGDRQATLPGLRAGALGTKKAALIALDQMKAGGVGVEEVLPFLGAETVKETAAWILARHPEWGEAIARHLRLALRNPDLNGPDRNELEGLAGKLAGNPSIAEFLQALAASENSLEKASGLLGMSRASMKEMPKGWLDEVLRSLKTGGREAKRAALRAIRQLPPSKADAARAATALRDFATQTREEEELRLEALALAPGGLNSVPEALWHFLKHQIDPTRAAMTRGVAAQIVGRAKLQPEQLLELASLIENAGPMEIGRLLGAFSQAPEEKSGLALLESLNKSKGLAALRPEQIRTPLTKHPASVLEKVEELANRMDETAAEQRSRLEKILLEMKGGDIRRGQAIFNGAKAACASCHSMGYLGGRFGPDLTRIGEVRNERDLLESIVFPSASFVRSYEPLIVATKSGELHTGLLLRDADTEVVVGTGPDASVRIARVDINEMRPGAVSLMPQGLEEQLSRQELADLLAFLKNTRWGAQ